MTVVTLLKQKGILFKLANNREVCTLALSEEIQHWVYCSGTVPLLVILTKEDCLANKFQAEETSGNTARERRKNRHETSMKTAKFIKDFTSQLSKQLVMDESKGFCTVGGKNVTFICRIVMVTLTLGMNKETEKSKEACLRIIEMTRNLLDSQQLKLLISAVWGHNMENEVTWLVYK